jgi:hypothetical protein
MDISGREEGMGVGMRSVGLLLAVWLLARKWSRWVVVAALMRDYFLSMPALGDGFKEVGGGGGEDAVVMNDDRRVDR